jgi:hypothetical protein
VPRLELRQGGDEGERELSEVESGCLGLRRLQRPPTRDLTAAELTAADLGRRRLDR